MQARARRTARGLGVAVLGLAGALAGPGDVAAQSSMAGVDEIAQAIVELTTRIWAGPRVPDPPERPRPEIPVAWTSVRTLAAVHATEGVSEARIAAVARALDGALTHFRDLGWPEPPPDAGRGGSEGFDLYLLRGEHDHDAHSDAPLDFGPLDAASVFATLDPTVPDAWLDACVAGAYAEAALLALDPAEAPAWRRATAGYLAYLHTGRFGCDDGAAGVQQAEPWRGWIEGAAGDGAGGALFLAALAERHGGRFVRDVWELARQSTWEGEGLRGAPDLWMALDVVLELSGEPLDDWLMELAIARSFGARGVGAPFRCFEALPVEAEVPLSWSLHQDVRPTHEPPPYPEVEPTGSFYVRVDVAGVASPGTRLRSWLRGEYGVRWGYAAIRLGPDGHEAGRMIAPPSSRHGQSYLPIELDPGTAAVLLVGTNLGNRLPDADVIDNNTRSAKIVLELARDD